MRLPDRPPLDIQGHRGARGLLPENTVDSFIEAVRHGVHAVELDLVVSADDQLVVSHEPWCSHHTCAAPDGSPITEADEHAHNIFRMRYEQLAAYDCGARGHGNFPRQQPRPATKPRLADVVEAVDAFTEANGLPPLRYDIEVKSRPDWDGRFQPGPAHYVQLVHDAVTSLGLGQRCTVQSFDPRIIEALHALDDQLEISMLVENQRSLDENLARVSFTPDIYAPFYQTIDEALVRAVHDRGMLLITWTVNHADEMRQLAELGVDGIITDYPDVAAEVFGLETPARRS